MSNTDVLSFICMDWLVKLETYLLLLKFYQRLKATANNLFSSNAVSLDSLVAFLPFGKR